MYTVTILGSGRAGGALAIALSRAGVNVARLIFRSHPATLSDVKIDQISFAEIDSIPSDILIIATSDPEISTVAEQIARLNELPKVALHLSGSLPSEVLSPLRLKGVSVGSMHPLVSISDAAIGAERFRGSYFCIEGDGPAVEAGTEIAGAIGGHPFTIDTAFKPLYHASAVMASGNVTALFDGAIEMLAACGLDRTQAQSVLLPLLQSTVVNLERQSTEDALTGPYVRNDLAALERHLSAFEGVIDDRLKSIYLLLAERSVQMMARSDAARMEPLAKAISVAKRKTGC